MIENISGEFRQQISKKIFTFEFWDEMPKATSLMVLEIVVEVF